MLSISVSLSALRRVALRGGHGTWPLVCQTKRGGVNGCARRRPVSVALRRDFSSTAQSTPSQQATGLFSERSFSIASVDALSDGLSLTWADGHRSRFHYVWLRDHCPSIYDGDTKQRKISHLDIPRGIAPAQVSVVRAGDTTDALLRVEWADAERTTSVFPAQWLRRACYSDQRRRQRELSFDASRTAWEGNSFKPPSVSFAEAMGECHSDDHSQRVPESDSGMWEAMRELWRHGLLLVRDVPEIYSCPEPSAVPYQDATEAFARRVGFVRRTLYGDMWSFGTFEGTDSGKDSAYSNIALDLHTDGAYMRDPPALQLFTCMFASGDGGGISRYVDGLRVAERLREADPSAYDFFRKTPLAYHCQDEGSSLMASGPVFDGGSEGSLFERLRYNDYDRLTLSHLPPEEVVLFYEHRRLLSAIVTDPKMELRLPLQPGTMAVIHNHRVMHGRTAFTGRRGLCGCYIGDDEFRSVLRQLSRAQGHGQLADSFGAGLIPPAQSNTTNEAF